jgi:2-oxo-3-hexenedioate decarboxylase
MSKISVAADTLESAVKDRQSIDRLTDAMELSLDEAYAVQAEVARRRVAAGETVIGRKLGLTAAAKQQQMNVDQPVYGVLLSDSVHHADDPIRVSEYIHPRVEPEIVFVLGTDLRGPGVTAEKVIAATAHVSCGLEIIDSRFSGFKFRAADVIADNTSAAGVVVGSTVLPPQACDWAQESVTLEVNGAAVSTSTGAATMGGPAEAVALLANWLAESGEILHAGEMVFTGGLTEAVALTPGTTVSASFGHLGRITVNAEQH